MARRRPRLSSPADVAAAYERWRFRVLEVRLAVSAGEGIGGEQRAAVLASARRECALLASAAARAERMHAAADDVFGAERTERMLRAALAGRSGWAPADDFSVVGPFAAPPDLVAEHRAAFFGSCDGAA